MLDAAHEACEFVQGKSLDDLQDNRVLTLALVKSIEIIGEAASRVSVEGRGEIPWLPWAEIIGMRNRLIHAYFDIDLERLWDTVGDDLPPLITMLEAVLG